MVRACRRLLPFVVVLGLTSCSQTMPSEPRIRIHGPTPAGSTPSDSTLAANEARWSASGLESYRFRFRWECFCVTEYVRMVDITVVRGVIVSVVDAGTGDRLGPQETARYRTIEGLFGFVREAMQYPAERISVAFDAGLGCPLAAQVDYVAGMADEEMGFRIEWLTSIPPR